MKKVYLILSRSQTMMAIAVRIVTRRYYNHISIALEPSLDEFYSFGRKYPLITFPAGFVKESKGRGFYKLHPNIPVSVMEFELSDEDYDIVTDRLNMFRENPEKYKYDLIHLPQMIRGKPYEIGNTYVCSVFVATLFKDIVNFGKDLSLVYPEDFKKLNGKVIYEGKIKDYKYEEQ